MLTLAEGYDRNTEDYVREICIIHIPLWRIMEKYGLASRQVYSVIVFLKIERGDSFENIDKRPLWANYHDGAGSQNWRRPYIP